MRNQTFILAKLIMSIFFPILINPIFQHLRGSKHSTAILLIFLHTNITPRPQIGKEGGLPPPIMNPSLCPLCTYIKSMFLFLSDNTQLFSYTETYVGRKCLSIRIGHRPNRSLPPPLKTNNFLSNFLKYLFFLQRLRLWMREQVLYWTLMTFYLHAEE